MIPNPPWIIAAVLAANLVVGTASWGDFGGHVVTRLPRGTPITVCGELGCWTGESWGYGPGIPGRIVDLDREVFRALCGDPAQGLCRVILYR